MKNKTQLDGMPVWFDGKSINERKARTRRLIQEGAVLEKVLLEVQAVGLDNLEEYLRRKLTGHD